MGQYKLRVDPNISDPEEAESLQGVIQRFYSLPGSTQYLNMPSRPGGNYIVTNRPKAFIGGNKPGCSKTRYLGQHFEDSLRVPTICYQK